MCENKEKYYKKVSKTMSYALRHHPEDLGLNMDEHGWVGIKELINGLANKDLTVDKKTINYIVDNNNKNRYSLSADGNKIRANQGHSINVDVELEEAEPPEFLYHGTSVKFIDSIKSEGIKPMSRIYVHLSKDKGTAKEVGSRHGKPVILRINTLQMYKDGVKFYLSKNGVWLTKFVDKHYINVEVQ